MTLKPLLLILPLLMLTGCTWLDDDEIVRAIEGCQKHNLALDIDRTGFGTIVEVTCLPSDSVTPKTDERN